MKEKRTRFDKYMYLIDSYMKLRLKTLKTGEVELHSHFMHRHLKIQTSFKFEFDNELGF